VAVRIMSRYLDRLASQFPMAKQAGLRRIQLELARGDTLLGAVQKAAPRLSYAEALKTARELAKQAGQCMGICRRIIDGTIDVASARKGA
jgi:hypothetical protein